MRIQYNKQTKMTWTYVPTNVVRFLDLKKGDDVEFLKIESPDKKSFVVHFEKKIKVN